MTIMRNDPLPGTPRAEYRDYATLTLRVCVGSDEEQTVSLGQRFDRFKSALWESADRLALKEGWSVKKGVKARQ